MAVYYQKRLCPWSARKEKTGPGFSLIGRARKYFTQLIRTSKLC